MRSNDHRAKKIIGIGIYKRTRKEWPSVMSAAAAFGVSETTVRRHRDSGEPLNGYWIYYEGEEK